jgi:hypothetical protein
MRVIVSGRTALRTAATLAIAASAASAQSTARDSVNSALQGAQETASQYAIPEIPAVTFLNGSSVSITQPVTPKAFVAALTNGVDAAGHVRQGFGIEASIFSLIPAFRITLDEYRKSHVKYALSNMQLSFAAVATSGDSTSTSVGYGIRAIVYDDGDPLLDSGMVNMLGRALLMCAPSAPPPGSLDAPVDTSALNSAARACADRKSDSLAKAYAREHWNSSRVMIAYAGGQRLKGSALSSAAALGDRVWLVGSYGFGPTSMIGYLGYTTRPAIDTVSGYSAWAYGARINFGSPTVNGFAEALGQSSTSEPPGVPHSTTAWSAGVEFRVGAGFWIETGFGRRFQETVTPEHVVVIANLRWGMLSKPALSPIPTP